ncbi:hypothetical protein [uncultured Aliiroseovarius sp.]|uniref:hypothetical protein n=1 Tax=uncultured Aliiroseovarius sp. TaxID=1658783 RepID=UPI0026261CE0|nr:hypothetical protein [uncultured Aliiroseovarius sp.]
MLSETTDQKLSEVIGHVCKVHINWETVTRQVSRALPFEIEVLTTLSPFVHRAFSELIVSQYFIIPRGVVNGKAIVITSSRTTRGSNAGGT